MSKDVENPENAMKTHFLGLGSCSLVGGSILLFMGGQKASVLTALLGMIALAIGASTMYAAGIFKAKESEYTPVPYPVEDTADETGESWRTPTNECPRRKKHRNRFSL